jgi:MFS family permease
MSAATARGALHLDQLPRGYRWRLMLLLTLVYASHSMDRSVTSVVLELVKHDFGLSDGEAGALGGLAHGIAFCLFVMPVGWLADRMNRRNLLAGLLMVWSGMTLLGGFARNFMTLLLIRFGVGAAEAGGSPVAMSMLGDVFPARERPTAVGFLYLGLAIGQGTIFFAGGYIASQFGWRWVYIMAGAPGLLIALALLAFARETVRGTVDGAREESGTAPSFMDIIQTMMKTPSLLLIMIAAACCSMASHAIGVWMTSLMIRAHGLPIASVGLILAIASGLCSGLGSLVAGPACSWIVGRGSVARLGYAAALVALLATPLGLGAIFSTNVTLAVVCIFGLGIMLGAWLPPGFGLALALAPPNMRASVMSAIQLATNFFALALAPILVGILSDVIGGPNSLTYAMGCVFSVMLIAAASFFGAGILARHIPGSSTTGGLAAH